jgi:hypothetical protein
MACNRIILIGEIGDIENEGSMSATILLNWIFGMKEVD